MTSLMSTLCVQVCIEDTDEFDLQFLGKEQLLLVKESERDIEELKEQVQNFLSS